MNQEDINKQILQELRDIKRGLPNGELKRVEKQVNSMSEDISEIKRILLDPKEGLIVEQNKNTEWRIERTSKIEFYDEQVHQLDKLKEWKDSVTKALWVGFTAIVGIIVKLVSDFMK